MPDDGQKAETTRGEAMAGQHGSTGGDSRRYVAAGVKCDLCTKVIPVDTLMIDGKTTRGPWAKMCEDCFTFYGVGLGTGKGQAYKVVPKGSACLAPRIQEPGAETFERWMAKVNANVIDISGLSCDDIGDYDYRAAWQRGEVPAGAAREALECASFPFDD